MRYFNTAGPCDPRWHYMVAPEPRLPEVRRLVEQYGYFALHAPRQTGKTTTLRALSTMLTAEGRWAALHLSCEATEPAGDDYEAAQRTLLAELERHASIDLPQSLRPPRPWPVDAPPGALTAASLTAWARACERPIVLFIDAIDALRGASRESVLRQLRAGYPSRPDAFPASIALAGLRDVGRGGEDEGDRRRGALNSPFNVKLRSARLGDFTEAEIWQLYGQHTAETGQPFTKGALIRAWELTAGQPWLVNALAREVIEEMRLSPPEPITEEHLDEAKERLIRTRPSHLDHLASQLFEEPVWRVMEPLLAGTFEGVGQTYLQDVQRCRELGLLSSERPLRLSNPIYAEALARALAGFAEDRLPVEGTKAYTDLDGRLELGRVIEHFTAFWKKHGQELASRMSYATIGPQLVLMAYLQRVINGEGFLDRVFGVGSERIELLLRWPHKGTFGERSWQREALLLKSWSQGEPDPLGEGLSQLEQALERHSLEQGTLVIFDRRHEISPASERTTLKKLKSPAGRVITVLRA